MSPSGLGMLSWRTSFVQYFRPWRLNHRLQVPMDVSLAKGVIVALLTSIGLLGACSEGDKETTEPAACAHPYACDCEDTALGVTDRRRCVGTPLCDTTDDCPAPMDAGYAPTCVEDGDLMIKGFMGRCFIQCDVSCPTGMECVGNRCWYADEP